MDLSVEEIIDQLDHLAESIAYHDLYIALDLAQNLRDELIQHTDDYDDVDDE